MTSQPFYFDWNFWVAKVGTQGAEYLRNLHERAGGSSTVTNNLVEVNTSITEINESVEVFEGGDPLTLYLIARLEHAERRIESLEADAHGNSISYA